MAHRSQCSSAGDNPLDPNYLPPHCREEYRIAVDALVEDSLDGYYQFLQSENVVDFLSMQEIEYIQCTVQVPQERNHPEQRYLESWRDGSSDTYWPIHSDLDAPGLDLGWPQLHRFIGPTEVTTLVNPAEADMPTIKEQARRLIKNAQEVVAVVMDMFTDVDIFADILDAAVRNVAVYIILDEQNSHHFINMVSNCRVNLDSIQFLRVRTVSGITYRCRSGKSFKGQMMDRFLLTDCRAVLSGNYSFMWSFEKIHRCLAHLFLGQLVSTFDEEFRILFAQSQPLKIENSMTSIEEFGLLPESQYACDRASLYKEQGKYFDSTHPEEWIKPPFDERIDMDWKKMPITRHESIHRSILDPLDQGPVDIFNKYSSQPLRTDPSYEQRPTRMPANIMENPVFRRHNYGESNPKGRTYQCMQHQGMTHHQAQGRQFHRGQNPYPTRPEGGYYSYDKFGGGAYQPADQYPDAGLPHEIEPDDSFDPVLNYLSSTSNVEMDQESEKMLPPAEAQFITSNQKRLSVGQPYVCQTSPTPSNSADPKQFFLDPNVDRKDPTMRQGLRNWRICSYLSAFENEGDDDLPPPQALNPFEVPPKPLHRTASGPDLSIPSFSNVREFKIPTAPRVSQLASYTKPIHPVSEPDDCATEALDTKLILKTQPDCSSTTELDKEEKMKQKEPKDTTIRREESFRRKHNATVPRGSRLRSSLIFSSQLEQHVSQDCPTAPGQQDEDTDKNQEDQLKLPYVSQVLANRRAFGPFEWRSYVRSATFDTATTQTSKTDDLDKKENMKDSLRETISKNVSENNDENTISKPLSPVAEPNISNVEVPKTEIPAQPLKSLLSNPPCVDMSDPDKRLMFFKELAAKRKAEKAAEAQSKMGNALPKPDSHNTKLKTEDHASDVVSLNLSESSVKKPTILCEVILPANVTLAADNKISTAPCGPVSLNVVDLSDRTNKQEDNLNCETSTSTDKEQRVSTDSDKIKLKTSQAAVSTHDSAGSSAFYSKPLEPPNLSQPIAKECSQENLPTKIDAKLPAVHSVTDSIIVNIESRNFDTANNDSHSSNPSLLELPPLPISALSEDYIKPPESHHLEHSTSSPTIQAESSTRFPSQLLLNSNTVQSITFDSIAVPSRSSSPPSSTPLEPASSNSIPTGNCSTSLPTTLFQKPEKETKEFLCPPPSSESVNQTTQESTYVMHTVLLCDPSQIKPDSLNEPTQFETPSTLNSVCAQSSVLSKTKDFEQNVSLTQPTTETYFEESNPAEHNLESELHESLSKSISKTASVESDLRISELLPTFLHTKSCLAIVSGLKSARPDEIEPVTSFLTSAEPPPQNTQKESSSKLDSIDHSKCIVKSSLDDSDPSLTIAQTLEMSPSEYVLDYIVPSVAETLVPDVENVDSSASPDGKEPVTYDLTSTGPPPDNTQKESSSKLDSNNLSKCTFGYTADDSDNSLILVQTVEMSPSEHVLDYSVPSFAETLVPDVENVDSSASPDGKEPVTYDLTLTGPPPENTQKESSSKLDSNNLSKCTFGYTADDSDNSLILVQTLEMSPSEHVLDYSVLSFAETLVPDVENVDSSASPDGKEPVTYDLTLKGPPPENTQKESSSKLDSNHLSKCTVSYTAEDSDNSLILVQTLEMSQDEPAVLDYTLPSSTDAVVSDLENVDSSARSDGNEPVTTSDLTSTDPPSPEESGYKSSTYESNTSLTLAKTQEMFRSEPTALGLSASSTDETAEKYETVISPTITQPEPCSSHKHSATDTGKTPTGTSPESLSDIQTKTTAKDALCPTAPIELRSVTEWQQSGPSEPVETGIVDNQSDNCKEPEKLDSASVNKNKEVETSKMVDKTLHEPVCDGKPSGEAGRNSSSEVAMIVPDEAVPLSPQAKQSKAGQFRYHSSTANVISSSNLRDDTKLLLEQISANSQSRSESIKESAVTDDDKEDEADKNVKRKKEENDRSLARAQANLQEREKLLEKLHNMRKERKVYSRFEMAP